MSEYKRLTKRYIDEQGINCVRGLAWDGEILHRRAELEDRIKNGTLVTVPYAIGKKLYCVDKSGYSDVKKIKVSLITIRHDGSVGIRLNHYNDDGSYCGCFKYDTKYYELFDNEAEAQARLKELQEKQE